MSNPSQALADFASARDRENLSDAAIAAMKKHVLDTMACIIYGSKTPWSVIVNDMIRDQGGKEEATLWLHSFRGPSNLVALGLGVMAHSFEVDDYHGGAKMHPGSVVVPAAFAVAENQKVSGYDFIRSLLIGYEVMIRAGLASGALSMRKRGWHITGVCGTFGAAATAGYLMGLDGKRMAHAFGLAGTQSAGLFAFTCNGADSKRLHSGRSAQSGIIAADLARRGFTGPDQVFECNDGSFCRAVSDDVNLEYLTKDLGSEYHALNVSIKPYSCCASIHSSIDALLWLVREYGATPKDVQEIIVHNHTIVKLQTSWRYVPMSPMQAQMNLEYCMAAALMDGDVGPGQFTESRIRDHDLIELAHKVRFEVDQEIEKIYPKSFPGKVSVKFIDGHTVSHSVPGPKGSPENPINMAEVETKFHSLTDDIVGEKKNLILVELLNDLESLNNIQSLIDLLR